MDDKFSQYCCVYFRNEINKNKNLLDPETYPRTCNSISFGFQVSTGRFQVLKDKKSVSDKRFQVLHKIYNEFETTHP